MQLRLRTVCLAAVLFGACEQSSLERNLVGSWDSGCSIDICTITTLKADHTFSERFDEKGYSDSYTGTWRVEDHQLVLHILWAADGLQDIAGKDLRLVISQFHRDTFVATLGEDATKAGHWKRRH
jgi:hypothetical protein